MQAFKCKICGGTITVDKSTGTAVCDYCGTQQTLPMFTDDSSKILYDSGNSYLMQGEYDKAEAVFNRLLAVNPQDAEIYWDIVLCKYGVTFVCDSRTGKYIPTCNRTNYDSVLHDKNYLNALKYADEEKAAYYTEVAGTIDNIQKGILSIIKNEKPFDVFISYKETGADGSRTKDSIAAQNLYDKLTEAGYKVFFSRVTLEDKIGVEYEPYIFSALSSSKVMLTICSSAENIQAPWVKNEWSRFLTLRQADVSKTLIPLYFDMPKSDLPDEFALLAPYDMTTEGFEQELLRGIKKIIPTPVMLAAQRKKNKKTFAIAAAACAVVAVALALTLPKFIRVSTGSGGTQVVVDPAYQAAMDLYNNGDYAQAAWAFAALGDTDNAPEMQKAAELAWRKSLASATATCYAPQMMTRSEYYINENGTVNVISTTGSANTDLRIKDHGRILSIAGAIGGDKLYALHEDGYVSNVKEHNGLIDDSEWNDIIKISEQLYPTINIALKSDGTMIYGQVQDEYYDYSWLEEITTWSDIVDFEVFRLGIGPLGTETSYGIIIGITADGVLCVTTTITDGLNHPESYDQNVAFDDFESDLESLEDITDIVVSVEYVYTDYPAKDQLLFNYTALTNSGELLVYRDGELSKQSPNDFCDVLSVNMVLKQNGDVINVDSGEIILHDIVAASNYDYDVRYISRTGAIWLPSYINDGNMPEQRAVWTDSSYKTTVWDEWLRRLD